MRTRRPPRRAVKVDPIESAIEVALEPGYFIKRGASMSFVGGLERVEQRIAAFVRSSPARAARLYEVFLAGCYEKAGQVDDSGANFGMFVERLFGGWVMARQASHADSEEIARQLVAWIDDDPHGFCYQLERDLVKVLDKPGLAAFERRIRERFETAVASKAVGEGKDDARRRPEYVRRRAAEILRAVLVKQRNVTAYVALCEATEVSPSDCVALAGMFRARGKPEEALGWVDRGIALDKQRPWSSHGHELAELRRELLQKLGRGDAALAAAWTDYEADPGVHSYADLMRYVPRRERAAWHDKAMAAAGEAALSSAMELWVEAKEIERLVDRLRNARDAELEDLSHYMAKPVADKLAKAHPDVAARLYRALGMRILKEKKSRYYDAALEHFGDARRCYERAKLSAKWEAIVREVRAEHQRKTGFMSDFERLVTGGKPTAEPAFLERAKARWSTTGR